MNTPVACSLRVAASPLKGAIPAPRQSRLRGISGAFLASLVMVCGTALAQTPPWHVVGRNATWWSGGRTDDDMVVVTDLADRPANATHLEAIQVRLDGTGTMKHTSTAP